MQQRVVTDGPDEIIQEMTDEAGSLQTNSVSISESDDSPAKKSSPQRSQKTKGSSQSIDLSEVSKVKRDPKRIGSNQTIDSQIEPIIEFADEQGSNSNASHENETDLVDELP